MSIVIKGIQMSSYHIVNYISFFVEFFQEQISILWFLVKYRSFKDELMHVRITNRLSENQKSHINWTNECRKYCFFYHILWWKGLINLYIPILHEILTFVVGKVMQQFLKQELQILLQRRAFHLSFHFHCLHFSNNHQSDCQPKHL